MLGDGVAEREYAAAAALGPVREPDRATLRLDHAAGREEADPGPGDLVRVEANERLEDPVSVLGRHAGTLVGHAHDGPVLVLRDRHAALGAQPGVLRRVVHQPADDL